MAEFDAAIALLGLVDPKDEKSSDSDSASSNDQEKTENKRSNKENGENKKSRDDPEDVVKTDKTDDAKSEASTPGAANKIMQEMDDCKEENGSPNGTNPATELKASDSPRAYPQGQSHQSGPVPQQEDQTSQQSSQDPSSEWDRRSQEPYVRSPHDPQQPQQSSGQYQQPGQSYQHHQAAAGHQQQQQRLPPHAQYQYSAQQQSPSQSQQSQPQSPPQYSQTQAYSTQQSLSNPPPRLPPISQISQPPTPSHHQPYPEHGPRPGYQDHGSYPPYQQPATGPPPGPFQHVEQHPSGYTQASPHVQPMYTAGAQGPQGQPPNIASRPSSYYSYRDPNEQYTAAGAPSSAPTPQNGYQHYSAPIDPALGGHSVPPVRPQPEPYPKERYYQPPIQPNGVPPGQRRAGTSSNPQGGAMTTAASVAANAIRDSNVWNAIGNSDGESILNAISVHYINGRNHTHASFATGDFLGAIICSSIHGCDTGKIICSHPWGTCGQYLTNNLIYR
ncbi:hypothetical protein V1507DRAFT_388365 [Lipomyces tetrasporus]